jgi:uncharacterized peroxidase-related enzyme
MTWIKIIEPKRADGRLKTLYERTCGADGQVDNILQAHSLRPHTLEGHMALYKSVLHHSGNLMRRWFLEAIGVFVSRLNGCDYCDHHHAEGMRKLISDEARFLALNRALSETSPGAPFSSKEQTVFRYVRNLTLMPADLEDDSLEGMRQAGFGDGEILEVNQVSAYFSYANRMVLGLGVTPEGETLGLAPSVQDDPGNWSHQ